MPKSTLHSRIPKFFSRPSMQSRVDNRTSGSRQLDLGPAFHIYIALSVIPDPQRALNIGYFLQKFCLYCDLEF